ncbi:MAG: methionyl-tRNA formyltransferase [Aureispira sp.]|nr:methionyl-tRNA formyltransferase [Aureispira sp.]
MPKIIIANCNPVHIKTEEFLVGKYDALVINKKGELTAELLEREQPSHIFFLHWSYIIPKKIWSSYNCIVFHMTDLPYGRGGSPLQNLIVRGVENTKVSALRVNEGLDTGDIFLKKDLNLNGTAEEIFLRTGGVIKEMIDEILEKNLEPIPQTGEPILFKRRKAKDGDISQLEDLEQVFDYIRMLDAEGYPKAFLETEHFRLEFSRASLKKDNILADVRIIKK